MANSRILVSGTQFLGTMFSGPEIHAIILAGTSI